MPICKTMKGRGGLYSWSIFLSKPFLFNRLKSLSGSLISLSIFACYLACDGWSRVTPFVRKVLLEIGT